MSIENKKEIGEPSNRGLVITRRVGEFVRIGPDIVIQLVEVRTGNQARIRILAPSDVKISRGDNFDSDYQKAVDKNATPEKN